MAKRRTNGPARARLHRLVDRAVHEECRALLADRGAEMSPRLALDLAEAWQAARTEQLASMEGIKRV